MAQHHAASRRAVAGPVRCFSDYRLRIAQVIRDYGLEEREEAPVDSRKAHPAEGTA